MKDDDQIEEVQLEIDMEESPVPEPGPETMEECDPATEGGVSPSHTELTVSH